jgi:hypothetical protein
VSSDPVLVIAHAHQPASHEVIKAQNRESSRRSRPVVDVEAGSANRVSQSLLLRALGPPATGEYAAIFAQRASDRPTYSSCATRCVRGHVRSGHAALAKEHWRERGPDQEQALVRQGFGRGRVSLACPILGAVRREVGICCFITRSSRAWQTAASSALRESAATRQFGSRGARPTSKRGGATSHRF